VIDSEIRALVNFRLEQAQNCLSAAKVSAEAGLYKDAANRSYYCIFHSMRAVLALEGFDSKKHSGIMSAFRQRYIKTKMFDSAFSDVIGAAFEIRNFSDYEDFYVVSKVEVIQQIENACSFLRTVAAYIEKFSITDL